MKLQQRMEPFKKVKIKEKVRIRKDIKLKIEGMHCTGCQNRLEKY